ncbi:type II toxin-antitoxin system mRNA interferase toxin, RelE/StbE family [Patescibacteria group bacterium]|nr:type II toxin-antitoxin system mRNA interferase toxin, RelE/StbE family [Patescibacteria group bacterium]MBU4082691.1 type II toxin-antitoxin system mRNA interferase toxin, RelE/StbE family [Patescibacteria group bacterium]MCG2809512.1 type II toxin-antitoxin system mRNA interferase toxin, RelE/StbE family [Candidatus Portnoybacteria bacterium]
MKICFHKNFEKQYKKLTKKEQNKVQEKLSLFLKDAFNPILKNHSLKGKYLDYRSINITGDLRAIYKYLDPDECIFVILGNHNNLYK